MSNTLTGPSTRYLAFQSCAGGPWQSQKTIPANREALFHTREAAQAYCDWRNGGIDARKSEPEAVEDEASGWRYNALLDRITEADGHVVAVPSGKYSWGHSGFRMMAAAPELKAALEAILPYAANAPRPLLDNAVKALEKAEGKG